MTLPVRIRLPATALLLSAADLRGQAMSEAQELRRFTAKEPDEVAPLQKRGLCGRPSGWLKHHEVR